MKHFYILFFLLSSQMASAQVVIGMPDLPQPNDVLITQAATLLQDVDLEDTGADYVWNFGSDVLQSLQQNTETNCVDVDDTPIAYQFLFNSPFDPDHNSDFAIGVEEFEVGTLAVTDAYMYYQNNAERYAITGMGASISGIPLAAVANDVDVIYQLPLEFAGIDTSESMTQFDIPTLGYWGMDQTRTYEVDGWGVLNIADVQIDVLRYKAIINVTDSVFSEAFGIGFNFPRPEAVEYRWVSPLYNVPVLQINTSGGIVTSVQTAELFEVSVDELPGAGVMIFPNPAEEKLNLSGSGYNNIYIYDANGKMVLSQKLNQTGGIDVSKLPAGCYAAVLANDKDVVSTSFIKK